MKKGERANPELRARMAQAQRDRWARRRGQQPQQPQAIERFAADATPIVVKSPSEVLAVANHWLEGKRGELARAEAAVKALRTLQATPGRRRLARERVRFLRRFVGALESGYLPIPRFDGETLELDIEELPAEALVAMARVKGKRLFDEVRYVPGRAPDARPGGHYNTRNQWTRSRRGARDPLVVGVIRTPEHRVQPANQWAAVRIIPSREEHFLIAWWRPEDATDADLF